MTYVSIFALTHTSAITVPSWSKTYVMGIIWGCWRRSSNDISKKALLVDFDKKSEIFNVVILSYDFQQNGCPKPTNEIWAHFEMVPNCNIAQRALSSQVNMLCPIERDRLCDFSLCNIRTFWAISCLWMCGWLFDRTNVVFGEWIIARNQFRSQRFYQVTDWYISVCVHILIRSHARDVTARDSFTAQSGGLWICESNFSDRAVRHACVTTRPVADGWQLDWCRNWTSLLYASFVSFLVQPAP